MELKVIDNKGQEAGAVAFDETILPPKSKTGVLHEVIVAYQAGQRSGTHATKTRAQVSGGGLKPWKQKGTGRARAGSTRSPLWRKGGIIFGPVPRNYEQNLPRKKKQLAFGMAFKSLLMENRLQVVSAIEITEPKTKHVAGILKKWQAPTSSILILDKVPPLLQRAGRNIDSFKISDAMTFNTYDCLAARKVFITEAGLGKIIERIKVKEETPS